MTDTSVVLEERNVLVQVSTSNTVLQDYSIPVVQNTTESLVVSTNTETPILVDSVINTVVTASGGQGPQGIPGSDVQSVFILAEDPVGGNRVVSTGATGGLVYPDMSSNHNTIIGVTKHSAIAGSIVEVQIMGLMTEPSWNWNLDDPIYIASNGMLSQTTPTSGIFQVIGYPVLSNKIFIDKQSPVTLG